jgi:hypothetical protein
MEIKPKNAKFPEIQSKQIGDTVEAGDEFLSKMRPAG